MADSVPPVVKQRLFGRTQTVHEVLGAGKLADILLWKDFKTSAGIVATVTLLWVLFELSGFTLLTLISNSLSLLIVGVFVWARICATLNRPPPTLPEPELSEAFVLEAAKILSKEINRVLDFARDVSLGSDFLLLGKTIAVLWVVATICSYFNSLTLLFLGIVLAFTLPVFYDKYEDKVDEHLGKGLGELGKVYMSAEVKVKSLIAGNKKAKKTE